jgi:GT2 family glycosyltransferase
VLLNWNGWADSLECLESLRRSSGACDVVLCDNASTDGSLENIEAWARGERSVDTAAAAWDGVRSAPIRVETISVARYPDVAAAIAAPSGPWLTLIPTGGNLGFAGGNNVGLRYGLARGYDRFWLLNTDTIVEPSALTALEHRMAEPDAVGLCGPAVRFYYSPAQAQCFGGARFDPRRAGGDYIGYRTPAIPPPPREIVEPQLDYITGCAMMVSRAFLKTVGPMCEDYFLYFEEMDWSVRARGQFSLGYAPDAVVFHKHGGSIGGATGGKLSKTSIKYSTRNRIIFTKKYFPRYLLSVYASLIIEAAKLAAKMQFANSWRLSIEISRTLVGNRTSLKPK